MTFKANGTGYRDFTANQTGNTDLNFAPGTGIAITGSTGTVNVGINSTYQNYISHGESAYNSLGNYLPLAGGVMTGTIRRVYDSASDSPMLSVESANQDTWLWRVKDKATGATSATSSVYGYGLKYIGTGNGVDNRLILYADNQNGSQLTAISINQAGQLGIGTDSDTNYRVKVNGNTLISGNTTINGNETVNGDATIGTKSKYYQRSTRGQIHHEFVGDDADYGVVKISHNATEGSGGPGAFTASLGVFDNRPNTLSGAHQPTFYVNRAGATRVPDLMGIDMGGSRVFTVASTSKVGINTSAPSQALSVVGDVQVTNNTSNNGCRMTYDATVQALKFVF